VKCVIPCGGNSTRFGGTNKCLTQIQGKSILRHNVDFWRNLGVDDFVFIIGGAFKRELAVEISQLGLKATMVLDRGNMVNLSSAIHMAKDHVGNRFVLALGDCLNVGKFKSRDVGKFGIGVAVTSIEELKKNYLVRVEKDTVTDLIEKPGDALMGLDGKLTGMGTMFLSKEIFRYMEDVDFPPLATSVDLTGALKLAMEDGQDVRPVYFEGTYINMTSKEDLDTAEKALEKVVETVK
jgi:NDP-sugar pyrophosphorylase family protein